MVFANLSPHEKEAFFSLLDEYFTSRPDLLPAAGNGLGSDAGRVAATSALQHAFSKTSPQEAASAINGLRRAMPSPASQQQASNPDIGSVSGRVAAAAAAFSTSGMPGAPRPPPRRTGTSNSDEQGESQTSRLIPQKKFADVDISSGKAMFSSLRNSTATKAASPPQVAPPTPAAFAPKRNQFAPPPVRRMDSTASKVNKTPSPPPPPPPPPARPQQEEMGDWAEALYDYSSDDPGDLNIQTGERLLIVDRDSDDWWTAEMEGRRGLVPAAYVKLL